MSLTFVVVGACMFVTGLALRPARAPGRLILMAGAVAGMLVAVFPEHQGAIYPIPHMVCAGIGCAGVVAWPAGAWRRGPSVPWGLRPGVSVGAVAVLTALVASCRHAAGKDAGMALNPTGARLVGGAHGSVPRAGSSRSAWQQPGPTASAPADRSA